MKKPVLIFTAADQNNFPYAVLMLNSLTKFHKPEEVDIMLFTNETRREALARLPKGVEVKDVTPFLDDPAFWYRQKPILAEQFMDDYELVLGMDADQLVLGDLNYIFDTKDYDVGVVVNWNRVDPQIYGFVEIMRLGIPPPEYYNAGFIAFRSKKFVHHMKVLCFAPEFNFMQYREQDVLAILTHFGNYNVRNFDAGDAPANYYAFHGLIGKGEWSRAVLQGDKIIVPRGDGDTPFPPKDAEIKVAHLGGGAGAPKDNWGAYFSSEVMIRINELTKPTG